MINYEKVFNTLVQETRNYVVSNNLRSMVLGISGGIDSTVVAAICNEVSNQTGIPLIGRSLPIKNKKDEFDVSKLVGEAFCTNFEVKNLRMSYQAALIDAILDTDKQERHELMRLWGVDELEKIEGRTPIANGNIQARCRMIHLYDLAGLNKGLVMSTDNLTKYLLGFTIIHGSVGDYAPMRDLWKTEVYGLANWLVTKYQSYNIGHTECYYDIGSARKEHAVNQSIALTPTDGLSISNSDLEQIGAKSYDEVDAILQEFLAWRKFRHECLIKEVGEDMANAVAADLKDLPPIFFEDQQMLNIDMDVIMKVIYRHVNSEFKREKSPIYIPRSKYEN